MSDKKIRIEIIDKTKAHEKVETKMHMWKLNY